MRALIAPFLAGGLLYAAVCLMMWLAQGSLIFLRQPLDEGARAALRQSPARELTVRARDGTSLHGWLRPAQGAGPSALLIYFGGNAEEVSWMQRELARYPEMAVATFNYRGYGLSQGEPSEAHLFADALELHDALAARPDIDATRVIAMGRSLGSGVAVHLAALRRLRAVVLVSPYDSLAAVGARAYPWLPVRWLMRHPFDSLSRAPRIDAAMLALVAEQDSVVPPSHTERLAGAWRGPHQVVRLPGADHINLLGHPGFWPAIDRFMGRSGTSRF